MTFEVLQCRQYDTYEREGRSVAEDAEGDSRVDKEEEVDEAREEEENGYV
jgi:hypothetical protein